MQVVSVLACSGDTVLVWCVCVMLKYGHAQLMCPSALVVVVVYLVVVVYRELFFDLLK